MIVGGHLLAHAGSLGASQSLSALLLTISAGGLSIGLAMLSFRYFEEPFLKLKTRFG
jgi:peptidoglycan/LPS O-acetylase OafA/YrhL